MQRWVCLLFAITISSFAILYPAHARVLKIATIAPDGTAWMIEMRKGAKQIEEQTQGRVKLKFYPGGIMGNDKSVLKKIRIGQLQGGALTGGSLVQIARNAQLYSLPFLFKNYEEVDYVRTRMDDQIRADIEKGSLVPVGLSEGGFAYIMSGRPIRSVDDLREAKFWVPEGDQISQASVRNAGVTPIILPIADVYTSLQTRLVDAVANTPMGTIAFQWHTKLKFVTDVPISYIIGILLIDKKIFTQLSPKDQTIVRRVMGEVFKRLDIKNRQDNINARQALINQGIEFLEPTEEEQMRWQRFAEDAIIMLREKGVYSQRMLEILQNHLQDFRNQNRAAQSG